MHFLIADNLHPLEDQKSFSDEENEDNPVHKGNPIQPDDKIQRDLFVLVIKVLI